MRKIYLSNTPREEALKIFLTKTHMPRKSSLVDVKNSTGLVTAEPVFAFLSMPSYHASAMDGLAVKARDTYRASDQSPVKLQPESGYRDINTGDPLPDGFDAVIMIEHVQKMSNGEVEIINPAIPWQHIRPVGEDVVAGEMVVPAYHLIRPPDIGALLAGGIARIKVLTKPEVKIIPTGSEIVHFDCKRNRGDIPDFNSSVISSYLSQWGASPEILPIVPDNEELLQDAVRKALPSADLLIIIAGSSAGEKDYTSTIIDEVGEIILHGIATRPGKPTILGSAEGKPLIGLPGYPVSAYLSLEWFVQPLIYNYYGLPLPEKDKVEALLGKRIISEMGIEEHVRMSLGKINNQYLANPLQKGAGITMSLVKADGVLIIPEHSLGYDVEEIVEVELYRSRSSVDSNIIVSGSHDLIIDLLSTEIKKVDPSLNISSTNIGSIGGINAVIRGQAHLAGIHLLDPLSGEYNIPYLEKTEYKGPLHLINLAYRIQGWIVPPGNPDGIKTIEDLAHKKLAFINRQKGAGTRILFDYLLSEASLNPQQIYGYNREEYTHLNVAASVAAGTAQVGMGILPAAKAFGLDFIPLVEERYDLLFSDYFKHKEEAAIFLNALTDSSFRKHVESLGGYSMRDSGTILYKENAK